MLGKILPRSCVRTASKLSTFESVYNARGKAHRNIGPWMLTVPQLETNTASSHLLPWRSQIPMTVRYKLLQPPDTKKDTEASNLLRLMTPSIITPHGIATWGDVTAPKEDNEAVVEDPTVTRETYRTFQRGTHRYRIVNNRPKAQVTQRIRRKRRQAQKLWDIDPKSRENAIIKRREDSYQTEKKRIQSSDWWDWYVPYDNKPMQF